MIPILSKLAWAARWRINHRNHNRRIVKMAQAVEQHSAVPASPRPPVVFFNASTRLNGLSLNAAFSLLSSWALRLAGTPVIHFVCQAGMSRCVLGTTRDQVGRPPPCATCIHQSRQTYNGAEVRWFKFQPDPGLDQAISRLSLTELISYRRAGIPLGQLVLPSLRWIMRRNTLEGDPGTRYIFRQYILSAWNIIQQFGALLDETKPQKVVVFNGMFYPEAAARWAAQNRGIAVITHEVGLRPFTGYFTNGEATAYPIDIPAGLELSAVQNQRLDAYLEQRFQGNFSMAGVRFWPEMKCLSPEFLDKAAGFKQVVPVFTNVIFDTSQGHANVIYPHMFAWLDAVLEIIRSHPETFFVIRAHPDESRPGKESLESVAMWVRHKEVERLPNVLFVNSGQFFSSYELIQRSKFVMVYNSTIGLEAAVLGMPVLCAGKARFTQLATVFFPASAAQYQLQAEQFLAAEKVDVPAEHRLNARRFLYYQLFKTSLPFDAFIEEDGIWKGYVRLKKFELADLSAERSPALAAVLNGILNDRDFLLDE